MKNGRTWLAIALVSLLCLGGVLLQCGDPDPEKSTGSVTEIKLRYNGGPIINDSLEVSLSQTPFTFTADVQTTGNASADFSLKSSAPGIAAVSGKTVTPAAQGQTTITATAAGDSTKTHAITLHIVQGTASYGILVIGGEADKTTAAAGDTVTLTMNLPANHRFIGWTVDPPAVTVTGNQFTMPASGAIVTANYEVTAPFNITNNFGQNAATEFLAQWHNDSDITVQKLQIVAESGDFANAQEITVTGNPFALLPFNGADPEAVFGDYPLRNIFRAHVTGLTPNTQYKYRMGDTDMWSQTFYHRTSGTATDFSFTVVSDPQAFENTGHEDMAMVLRAANEYDTDNRFFIMCGDIVEQIGFYPKEIDNYTKAANVANIRTPIAATQGNHDTYWAAAGTAPPFTASTNDAYRFNESRVFNAYVTFPGNGHQYSADTNRIRSHSYYFYYDNVLVIMLNTMFAGNDSSEHTAQSTWLRNILQHDKDNGLSKYIIIGTHIALYSGREVDRWLARSARDAYGPVINDFDVDIFFAGHDHVYARSRPHKITSSYPSANVTAVTNGTVFSIASATGPKFYDVTGNIAQVMRVYPEITTTIAEQQPGMFINVKVTAEKLIVSAIIADAARSIIDEYEVPAKR